MSPSEILSHGGQSYIASAVTDAHAAYLSSNPISAKAHESAAESMPGGNTRTVLFAQPFPLCIRSGAGKTLTSVDGHTYTDFLGEYSAGIFGHSNPLIEEAIAKAMKGGWNFGAETLYEKELARKVTGRFSKAGMDLVRFTNSGTEANMLALSTAIAWTGRKKILVFSSSYHGSTFMFPMALCKWSHSKSSAEPPLNLNLPFEFVMAPFNNLMETKAIVGGLPTDSLAAILIEPVQGSGGCRPALPEFLKYLREKTEKLGALFIVDEVMTSRLGPSGYLETLGIKADLITLGKWIGGGMSFGAFGGRRDIMEMFDPAQSAKSTKHLYHPGTFNNNVFSMSAGSVALDIYNEQKVNEFNARGDRMKAGITRVLIQIGFYPKGNAEYLRDILEIDSFKQDVRLYTGSDKVTPLPKIIISGRGTMLNLRFTGEDANSWHNLYYHHMLQKGIYLASRGYTPMNLEITDEDIDMFVSAVEEFLTTHVEQLNREM